LLFDHPSAQRASGLMLRWAAVGWRQAERCLLPCRAFERRSLGGIVVLAARIGKGVIIAAALGVFGGCQAVGPIAIDAGRDRYNNIIQSTSKQQAFENIIRVHNNEPTSFMDVTEVDATQTVAGSLSGSVTNIGAKAGTSGGTLAGQVGSITPGVTYSESPLIRYVPLVGQGLVEQTVGPVNTDALASLYDSGWPAMSLVDLAMPYLTPDHGDVGAAVNLIAELDFDERLRLASTKSDWTKKPNASGNSSDGKGDTSGGKKTPTSSSTDDTLMIYFLRRGSSSRDKDLWDWLMRLYRGTQLKQCPPMSTGLHLSTDPKMNPSTDNRPQDCMLASAPFLELRTAPVTQTPNPNPFSYTAPLMRTYSALGILKSAAQPPNPRIAFVRPSEYDRITHYWWNDPERKDSLLCAYIVDPQLDVRPDDVEFDHTVSEANRDQNGDWRADRELRRWLEENAEKQASGNGRVSLPYVFWRPGFSDKELANVNARLWALRRYMLIIKSDAPPPANAYVAYFDRGLWYYIAGDDRISQKNFNLISLFLTVMAIPPANPPLTTSISIGGG
jgi:hypothetical protein